MITALCVLGGVLVVLQVVTLLAVIGYVRLVDEPEDTVYGFRMPEQTDPDE